MIVVFAPERSDRGTLIPRDRHVGLRPSRDDNFLVWKIVIAGKKIPTSACLHGMRSLRRSAATVAISIAGSEEISQSDIGLQESSPLGEDSPAGRAPTPGS